MNFLLEVKIPLMVVSVSIFYNTLVFMSMFARHMLVSERMCPGTFVECKTGRRTLSRIELISKLNFYFFYYIDN